MPSLPSSPEDPGVGLDVLALSASDVLQIRKRRIFVEVVEWKIAYPLSSTQAKPRASL